MMSRRTMIMVIIAMTLSILGIGIIQVFWFKASVEQESKNFDDKVMVAMGIVKDKILEDFQDYYETKENILPLYKEQVEISILKGGSFDGQRRAWRLRSQYLLKDNKTFIESIDNKKLNNYIHNEFEQQGIKLDYDYGIFSTQNNGYVILNGNYVVSTPNTQASYGASDAGLHNTPYELSLFEDTDLIKEENYKAPAYLKASFPRKNRWLWRKVLPSILLSVLFTGLILGSFVYALYTIVRQKHVSQMKTDFINNMTHEFKTPIATISLATESINSPVIINNEDKIRRFTKIIKQENERMLGQVEKVLQIAMLDNDEFQVKKDTINLHELIDEAISNIQLKVEKREGKLVKDLKATHPIILGDETHISNIINNLLDNSEKYSPEKLYISVSSREDKDNVIFTITDKGQGMTKEQTKHVFERFYRAHTGNVHNVKGFGLGLSYVKAIVDAQGGEISVTSELGKGSSFTVKLPKKIS